MEHKLQKFFLGANSCTGFVSHFADSYSAAAGWRAYLIKGGPGTGKSSLMKYLAARGYDSGERPVLCPCSSDPMSLDGVLFEKRKIALLDATAPHIVEPTLPGACEQIINLGDFWDSKQLRRNAAAISAATEQNRRLHKTAAGFLKAAGQILEGSLDLADSCTDRARTAAAAERYAHRYLPEKGGTGKEWVRFLQGITPLGIVTYADTIRNFYPERVILSDPYGGVSAVFMRTVRACALAAGYEIITVKNAFLPERLIDHILVPELGLAFVTENPTLKLDGDERRIHARRFTDAAGLHAVRQRLQFRKKVARELLSAACETLACAKTAHDGLEKYYVSAMDFEGIAVYAAELAEDLFG